ncbi:MAG TPA: 4Fe-4S binding protein [Planctomycetota bacterium]|nr:4Fe-4S binding protein [Planctomycetota bacterium]
MTRILLTILVLIPLWTASGAERFPPPEFKEGHQLPETTTPPAREAVLAYVDVAVLAAALGLAAWLVLRRRSRRAVFVLIVFSLLYFGFYRRGCICPIGSIQNVALAVFDTSYAIPITVLAFFLLPLVFALVFGRVFCSSVCPLGAAQDLVLFRPLKVPTWLAQALGLLPYVYLGLAVLLAAGGSSFIICQYDPFVPFFRMSGSIHMLIMGGAFLVLGMFVGRAYCRFLCPYGALLNLASRLSRWRVTITPDECIKCRLCEEACPFDAIRKPTPAGVFGRAEGKALLGGLILLLPVLIAAAGWLGNMSGTALARSNTTIRIAELVRQDAQRTHGDPVNEVVAFRKTGRPDAELFQEADSIRRSYMRGGWLFGGWVGLVIGLKLIGLSIRRTRTDYEAERGSCMACARCYAWCPQEHQRLKPAVEKQ